MTGWRTRGSRVVYANRWIRVREDDVVRPDGEPGVYGVVEMVHPAVFVVPVTDAGEVVLVEVDRYPTGGPSWEVPAGGSDGEDPLIAARRELAEETGLRAGDWTELGRVFALNGVADAPEHVFLARDLARVADPSDEQRREGIVGVRVVPFGQALALVADGTITDGETVTALALAAIRLGRLS